MAAVVRPASDAYLTISKAKGWHEQRRFVDLLALKRQGLTSELALLGNPLSLLFLDASLQGGLSTHAPCILSIPVSSASSLRQ